MLYKDKTGQAVYFFIIALVTIVVGWIAFVLMVPIAEPFIADVVAGDDTDLTTKFLLAAIPFWLFVGIVFYAIRGGR
jgi:hypothetical protein